MNELYAVVGSWSVKDSVKGITTFRYLPDSGELDLPLAHYDSDLSAGHQCYDAERKILYVADECENHPGEAGGGGFVRAYRVEPETGRLEYLNETCVLMTKPAYIALDPSGKYLLAACHSGRSFVTKAVHDSKGNWTSAVLYDDAGITLVRINEDGSLGAVCDVALHTGLTENRRQVHAHPHSIVGSPDGSIYFACDKGLDRIYSYQLDRENGKLIPQVQTKMEYATAPRYSVFHPTLPIWYENNETGNKVYAFQYDSFGVLKPVSVVSVGDNDGDPSVMPSDIVLHPNGSWLYVAVRRLKTIAAFRVDGATGALGEQREYTTDAPVRGFCISPDGRFLLAACEMAGTVKVYKITENGALCDTGRSYEAASAANIQIITI